MYSPSAACTSPSSPGCSSKPSAASASRATGPASSRFPIIWFYTGATGWQASAIRATIMSSVLIIGWILRRPNNLLNSLAASALLILLWQPEQLFQPGFQLSFLLLLTMAVWPALGEKAVARSHSSTRPTRSGRLRTRPRRKCLGQNSRPPLRVDNRPRSAIAGRATALVAPTLDDPFAWLLGGLNLSLASLICSLPVIAAYFNLISFSRASSPTSSSSPSAASPSAPRSPVSSPVGFPYLPELAKFDQLDRHEVDGRHLSLPRKLSLDLHLRPIPQRHVHNYLLHHPRLPAPWLAQALENQPSH